jgi:hypothetical protein
VFEILRDGWHTIATQPAAKAAGAAA